MITSTAMVIPGQRNATMPAMIPTMPRRMRKVDPIMSPPFVFVEVITSEMNATHGAKQHANSNERLSQARGRSPAFILDLDGTLVDSVYQHVLAWSEALERAR